MSIASIRGRIRISRRISQRIQEVYANTKIDDGTDVAELMHIFTKSDAYDFVKFPRVSARKKQFKENKGGQEEVCDLVENYAKECAEKAAEEAAKKAAEKEIKEAEQSARTLFENGVSYDVVRASIRPLTDEQLQNIYETIKKQ